MHNYDARQRVLLIFFYLVLATYQSHGMGVGSAAGATNQLQDFSPPALQAEPLLSLFYLNSPTHSEDLRILITCALGPSSTASALTDVYNGLQQYPDADLILLAQGIDPAVLGLQALLFVNGDIARRIVYVYSRAILADRRLNRRARQTLIRALIVTLWVAALRLGIALIERHRSP